MTTEAALMRPLRAKPWTPSASAYRTPSGRTRRGRPAAAGTAPSAGAVGAPPPLPAGRDGRSGGAAAAGIHALPVIPHHGALRHRDDPAPQAVDDGLVVRGHHHRRAVGVDTPQQLHDVP